MIFKTLLSRHTAKRLEHQGRLARRALRDLQREETKRIHGLENRARGLRLYAAWSRKPSTDAARPQMWQPLGTPALVGPQHTFLP